MKAFLPLFAALLALGGCGGDESAAPRVADVRTVRAERAGPVAEAPAVRYAGTVHARYETDLAFRVGGRVQSRTAEVGTRVRAGEVLATLDPRDYALDAAAARAQLAAAEAEAKLARADIERFRALRAQNFISQAELDRREALADAAQARVLALRAEASRLGNQQAYTRLTAPHAGVVTAIAFEAGQVVAAGQPLAQLARSGEREIRIDVPENGLDALRAARALDVRLWSVPGKAYRGRLRELAPMADAATRTYRARISLVEPDDAVRLGMTATVEALGSAAPSLTVPQSALFRVNGRPQLWVVDPATRKVATRSVELGELKADRAEIRAGLAAGEWVVTAGVHKLAPGQEVRLVESARS